MKYIFNLSLVLSRKIHIIYYTSYNVSKTLKSAIPPRKRDSITTLGSENFLERDANLVFPFLTLDPGYGKKREKEGVRGKEGRGVRVVMWDGAVTLNIYTRDRERENNTSYCLGVSMTK